MFIQVKTESNMTYLKEHQLEHHLKKTSDIIFIMMSDVDFNVENHIVGWLFGAYILPNRLDEYDASITEMVDIYENENGIGE